MRKHNKGEYVNVNTNRGFLYTGKIINWKYYRENKTYDYLVENLTGIEQNWLEEGYIDNLKIHLPREDEKKMDIFYEALNTTDLKLSFQHNEKKQTYILVGEDLRIAKTLFVTIMNSKPKETIAIYDSKTDKHFIYDKKGTFQKSGTGHKFLCHDCGHIHGNER